LQGELNTTLRCGDGAQRNVGIRTVPQPVGDSVRLDVFVSERGVERPIRAADVAVLDLLSNLPGVYALVLDPDLRVRHARGMTRTHWCRDDEVIGRELVSLLEATDDNAQQLAALRREIASDAPWAGLLRPLRADGSGFPAHVFAMVRQHPSTREPIGHVHAGREANEEVELRSQLHRARRMATIGEVATSVAREVSAGLVAARSVLDADIPRIGDARDSLTHLQRMTQTLLSFSSDVSVDRRQNA